MKNHKRFLNLAHTHTHTHSQAYTPTCTELFVVLVINIDFLLIRLMRANEDLEVQNVGMQLKEMKEKSKLVECCTI